jgi:hypothetical protein
MAQKVQVLLVDDTDGAAADESVTFSLDGVSYGIDLTADHARELRESFAHWAGNARKVSSRSGNQTRGASVRRSSGTGDATKIREWARANGRSVSERGRISADVKAAYQAAH